MCRVARSTARVVDRCDRRALRARGDPTRRRAIEVSKIHARLTPTATGLRRRRRRRERLERALRAIARPETLDLLERLSKNVARRGADRRFGRLGFL